MNSFGTVAVFIYTSIFTSLSRSLSLILFLSLARSLSLSLTRAIVMEFDAAGTNGQTHSYIQNAKETYFYLWIKQCNKMYIYKSVVISLFPIKYFGCGLPFSGRTPSFDFDVILCKREKCWGVSNAFLSVQNTEQGISKATYGILTSLTGIQTLIYGNLLFMRNSSRFMGTTPT